MNQTKSRASARPERSEPAPGTPRLVPSRVTAAAIRELPLRVATEQSVAIDAFNEPQPDIILTAEPKGDGPIPLMSVAMLVEVSASTLTFDLTDKTRIYARAGIMEYWVVDANRRVACHFPR